MLSLTSYAKRKKISIKTVAFSDTFTFSILPGRLFVILSFLLLCFGTRTFAFHKMVGQLISVSWFGKFSVHLKLIMLTQAQQEKKADILP